MSENLWDKAEKLASQPYEITIEQDELSDGQTVYIARNPKLPGCKSQGNTIDEAKANLAEARVDYIQMLLEEGLSVPEPMKIVFTSDSPPIGTTNSFIVTTPIGDNAERFILSVR